MRRRERNCIKFGGSEKSFPSAGETVLTDGETCGILNLLRYGVSVDALE